MSVHLLVDFLGHSLISREEILSYRDSISKLVILAFLLTPDVTLLFIVIPEGNCFAFMLIRYLRYVAWIAASFLYLEIYGGRVWKGSKVITIGVLIVDIGFILKFISYFNIRLALARTIGNWFLGIGILLLAQVTYQYIRQQLDTFVKKFKIDSDDYCCNVYLVAFWITCFGHAFILIFYDFPNWYEIKTETAVAETMIYTVYYVVITVFQGKAALVDAVASKVALCLSLICLDRYMSIECV